jgi:hypothetical protein
MGVTFALMVVMAIQTGQPAWVLPGVVGPVLLMAVPVGGIATRRVVSGGKRGSV